MKKILIGTHNIGKFREISFLLNKKIKKILPSSLKIRSPKETGKTFLANAKLKAQYFSKYVNFPVISDDSGLCIKALNGNPGIYSARLAKRYGSFFKAMQIILKKMKNKKIDLQFLFVVYLIFLIKKNLIQLLVKLKELFQKKLSAKKVSDMIQFLFLINIQLLLGKCLNQKKFLLIIDISLSEN